MSSIARRLHRSRILPVLAQTSILDSNTAVRPVCNVRPSTAMGTGCTSHQESKRLFQKNEMDRLAHEERDRSARRRFGVKAHLKSWATGDSSTVGMWRLRHAVCTQDGTNAGLGMGRLAGLATSERSSSEQNCARELRKLLAVTSLPKMIQAVPHTKGKDINSTQKSTKRLQRRRQIQEKNTNSTKNP